MTITVEDIKKGNKKLLLKGMFVGATSTGKTYTAATFPKCYIAFTEPEGSITIMNNPQLHKNIYGWDEFIPVDPNDTQRVFTAFDKKLIEVRQLVTEGKIETFILDNMTYFSTNRWFYIKTFKPVIATRTGEIDLMRTYGVLHDSLYEYLYMKILSLPCNVIITAHEQLESNEVMDKKPDKTSPIVPAIVGKIRDECLGMMSFIFYLSKVPKQGGGYKFLVRTNLGQGKSAKNRFNLPEIIEDVSYTTIYKAIMDGMNKETK